MNVSADYRKAVLLGASSGKMTLAQEDFNLSEVDNLITITKPLMNINIIFVYTSI